MAAPLESLPCKNPSLKSTLNKISSGHLTEFDQKYLVNRKHRLPRLKFDATFLPVQRVTKGTAILTGSSHPELKEIANALATDGRSFYFVSGLVFSPFELRFLKRIFPKNSRYQSFVFNRTVNVNRSHLIRSMLLFEIAFLILFYLPHQMKSRFVLKLSEKFDVLSKIRGEKSILKLISQNKIQTLIAQNSFYLSKIPSEIALVEIAYHGSRDHESLWHKFATQQWPEWKDTWRLVDNESDDSERNTYYDRSFRTRYIVVSSSFSVSPKIGHDINSIIIPLGHKGIRREPLSIKGQTEGRNFIFLGSLGLRKGLPLLLEASAHLEKDSKLRILGRAERFAADQLLKQENEKIEVTFNPNREYVLQSLLKSDIFLFPRSITIL
jgi:glycosyltransferase involved in cell wall biosynthesis